MDIKSIAIYLKLGYRVRRAVWEPEEWLRAPTDWLERMEVSYSHVWNRSTGTFEKRRHLTDEFMYVLTLDELLADDWEVITDGIRTHFNKSGQIEYEDDPDWDNYVYDGWGDEDEQ